MKAKIIFLGALLFFFLPRVSLAKQYEIFDGQFYNGLYYPLVDIIEWQDTDADLPHLEFHLHSKEKTIEVTGLPGESGGKPVLWIMYDLKFRGERICRKVVAPAQFKEGMALHSYKDTSPADYNVIYFSTQEMKGKNLQPYLQEPYQPCTDEMASNKPGTEGGSQRVPASTAPASAAPPAPTATTEKKDGKGLNSDYDNAAVPFSF